MKKSDEIRAEIANLQNEVNALVAENKAIPAEKSKALKQFFIDLGKAEAAEAMEKEKSVSAVSVNVGGKMDKKKINAAIRDVILGVDVEKAKQVLATATGNNGAVDADGGVLIPNELLDVQEHGGDRVDLREYTTNVTVHSRAGSVPAIDYDQDLDFVDFDENTDIAKTKAVFTAVKYALASKGAIIPISRELISDADADVVGLISKLFNFVYLRNANKDIVTKASAAVLADNKVTVTALADKAGIDAIKKAVNTLPTLAGANCVVVMNKNTFSDLANVADKNGRYYLTRDANGATIRQIESRPVLVVENKEIADNTVLVGDLSAIEHIAFPGLEVASSTESGFSRNSVDVRAIARFTDISTYDKAFKLISQSST